jgi:hypothetical protein
MTNEPRTFFQSSASGFGLTAIIIGLTCLGIIFIYDELTAPVLIAFIGISLIGYGGSLIYRNSF